MVAVPPPTDPPVLAPARNEGALGLGYYIPPELRQFGRNVMSFARAVDPVQGIMRGMRASGRAFDSELPSEERKAAAVEAAVETLAPVGMIGIGSSVYPPPKDILTHTKLSMKEYKDNFNSFASNWRFCMRERIKNAGTQILKELRIQAPLQWKEKYNGQYRIE